MCRFLEIYPTDVETIDAYYCQLCEQEPEKYDGKIYKSKKCLHKCLDKAITIEDYTGSDKETVGAVVKEIKDEIARRSINKKEDK